jgi:hypothetical protein
MKPAQGVIGGILSPLVGGMKQNHAEAPPLIQATPPQAATPAPVDSEALAAARTRDLENSRRTNAQSLRIDMPSAQGGSGVFIPS